MLTGAIAAGPRAGYMDSSTFDKARASRNTVWHFGIENLGREEWHQRAGDVKVTSDAWE